jgi:AcrR family transcriptional regulator
MTTALFLFYRQGFKKTSIDTLVKKAGVSKGAFYHYFPSKEAVLEEIIKQLMVDSIDTFRRIAADSSLDAVEKIRRIIIWPSHFSSSSGDDLKKAQRVVSIMTSLEGTKLFDQMQAYAASELSPYLLQILEQGVQEGKFQIAYPEEMCDFFIEFITGFKRKMLIEIKERKGREISTKFIYKKIKFFNEMVNKILGLPSGTVKLGTQRLASMANNFKNIFSP